MAINETVAEIAKELRAEPLAPNGEKPRLHYLADRIEAAHKREIAAKDAEIAELRECMKPILSVRLCDGGTQPISDALCAVAECKSRWRKALEGLSDEKDNP